MKTAIASIVLLGITALLLCCPSVVAQDNAAVPIQHIEAVGSARPAGEPQATDEDEALASALRRAILDWAKKQPSISPSTQRALETEVAKSGLPVLKPFFSEPQEIYHKKRTGYCEIKIGADMHTGDLEQWVARLKPADNSAVKKLRVMVCIPEHHLQRPIPDPAGETELVRMMIKEGFRMVDQKQVATIRDKDAAKRWKSDPAELLAIAQSWGADILIVGEAFSQDVVNPTGGPPACRARIEAKAILCDTGEVLASEDGEGGESDLSPAVAAKAAIRQAANRLADKMIPGLLASHSQSPAQSRVQVVLLGVDFDAKSQFQDLLDDLKGTVTGFEETSYVEPRAELQVSSSLGAGELARKISQAAKNKGISFKVVEQSNRRLVLQYPVVGPSTQPVQRDSAAR